MRSFAPTLESESNFELLREVLLADQDLIIAIL
jgi:hypothetical protein